jgi:hypothetical protein
MVEKDVLIKEKIEQGMLPLDAIMLVLFGKKQCPKKQKNKLATFQDSDNTLRTSECNGSSLAVTAGK